MLYDSHVVPQVFNSLFKKIFPGGISLFSGVIGALFGGWVMKRYKLECLGLLKFSLILVSISLLFVSAFIINCDEVPFAGVTVQYGKNR